MTDKFYYANIIKFENYHNGIKNTDMTMIKQFVVTNYSKERPGTIVNETLKNRISMLKDISKESCFYADFKYISFIKFSLSSKVTSLRKFALFWK